VQIEKYCSDWCLKLNVNKTTTVIVLDNARRTSKKNCMFQNKQIQLYLGIHLTVSSSFHVVNRLMFNANFSSISATSCYQIRIVKKSLKAY